MRLSARCHVPPAARRGPDPSRPGDGARSWPGTAPVSGSDLLTPHQTSSSSTSSSSGSGAGDAAQPRRLQQDLIKPRWKKQGKRELPEEPHPGVGQTCRHGSWSVGYGWVEVQGGGCSSRVPGEPRGASGGGRVPARTPVPPTAGPGRLPRD